MISDAEDGDVIDNGTRRPDADFITDLWLRRRLIAAMTIVALLGGIIYLHLATYRYTAEMQVIASQTPGNTNGLRSSTLGGLASLVGVSVEGDTTSPFRLYLEELTSRDTAAELVRRRDIARIIFSDQWDAAHDRWRERERSPLREGVKALFGFPALDHHPPGAAEMQDYLRRTIKVDDDAKRVVTTVRYDDADPNFAVRLLQTLNVIVDQHLRAVALARASEYARFLDAKLQTITIAEHRVAITEALSEQEKQIMLASSSAPYAADPIEAPVASLAPTSPRAVVVLVASVALGLVTGMLTALFLAYLAARRLRALT